MHDNFKCAVCNSYLQFKDLVVCMLVVHNQTQNFRQKRWLRRPEAMSGSILPAAEENWQMLSSRSETTWQILIGTFVTTLKKQNKHKEEFEDCDKAEKAR